MRKISTILILTLFACTCLMAQKKNAKFKLGWGLKTGMNITHFRLDDLNDEAAPGFDKEWRTGFVLGAFVNIPVYKKFSVQTEFLYSSMGGDYYTILQDHIRARYNYFSIPVMAKFNFCKNWSVLAGPQFDLLIQGKEKTGSGTYKVSDNLKDHDILATGGIEYQAGKCIQLQARYMRGFNDLDFRANGVRYYNEGVQLTFGVKF